MLLGNPVESTPRRRVSLKSKKSKKTRSRTTRATSKRRASKQNDARAGASRPFSKPESNLHNTDSISRLQTKSMRRTEESIIGNPPMTASKFVRFVSNEKSRVFRRHLEEAVKAGKVFTLDHGPDTIRLALQRRGWIEKSNTLKYGKPQQTFNADDSNALIANADADWAHRMLLQVAPTFIWTQQNRNAISWSLLQEHQIISLHPNANFTTKVGLASCLRNSHWVSEAGVAYTLYPRCYRLLDKEQRRVFLSDYRLTAAIGLLQYVVGTCEQQGVSNLLDPKGRVPLSCIDFAIRQVKRYVRARMHEDLDRPVIESEGVDQWYDFLLQYYGVVLYKEKMVPGRNDDTEKRLYESSKAALLAVAPFWRTLSVDGTNNVWICKPGAKSRGQGIVLKNKLESLVRLIGKPWSGFSEDWVVQKYIERPLLIYGTKFDIRQWFIVSNWNPLTVWIYRDCYLRFCSNPFSIEEFHESIHLCNFAIQNRYKNSQFRDPALPRNNMWDNYTFQAYLRSIGRMDQWSSVIYPGIKKSILGVLLASNEDAAIRKNSFELYGADFLLSDDFTPWLLEINSGPSLAPSTSVTSRMVQQCLEDCIKVIVDHRDDPGASTGMFECTYKQLRLPDPQERFIEKFYIQGKRMGPDARSRSGGLKAMTKVNLRHIKSLTGTKSALSVNNPPSSEASPHMQNGILISASTPSTAVSGRSNQRYNDLNWKASHFHNEEHLQRFDDYGGSSTEQDSDDLASAQESIPENAIQNETKIDDNSRGEYLPTPTQSKKRVNEQISAVSVHAGRRKKEVLQPKGSPMKLKGARTRNKKGENKSAVFAISTLPTKGAGEEVTARLSVPSISKKLAPTVATSQHPTSNKLFIQKQDESLPRRGFGMQKTTAKVKSPNSRTTSNNGVGRIKRSRRKKGDDILESQKYRINIIPIKQRHSPILQDNWSKPSSIRSLLHSNNSILNSSESHQEQRAKS